jgi:hypothetical protein
MRFAPIPSRLRHCRPPPSNRFTGAPRVDSSLGERAPSCTVAVEVIFGAEAPPERAPAAIEVRPNRASPSSVRDPFSPPQVSKVGSLRLVDRIGRNRLEIGAPKSKVEPPILPAMKLPLLALFSPADGEENHLGRGSHDRQSRLEGK